MTLPIALFASIATVAALTFTFLLIVYLKEYAREEKLLKQFPQPGDKDFPIYLVPVEAAPAPKPKKSKVVADTFAPTIKSDKNKKNIN